MMKFTYIPKEDRLSDVNDGKRWKTAKSESSIKYRMTPYWGCQLCIGSQMPYPLGRATRKEYRTSC